jgi:hypothetical protein
VEIARSLGISDSTLSNSVRAEEERVDRDRDPEALTESERLELRRLRREERAAADGHGDPAQGCRLLKETDPVSRFRFVKEHQNAYPVKGLCRSSRCPGRSSTRGETVPRVTVRPTTLS